MKSYVALMMVLVLCLTGIYANVDLGPADAAYDRDEFAQAHSLLLLQLDNAAAPQDKAEVDRKSVV